MHTEAKALELTVERAVAGGRCLARHEGKVVLVSGALPGERVRVRLTRDEKRFAEGEAVEVLEAHPKRRQAPCPHAAECGGCDYQHAERDLQLEMKRQVVVDAFRRIAKLDIEALVEGPEPIGPELGWRNRLRLSRDPAGRPGLLRRGTHDVVPIEDCLLMQPAFGESLLPWLRMLPPWHRVGVRIDADGGTVLLLESGPTADPKARKRLGSITREMDRPDSVRGMIADGVPLVGKRDLLFRVSGAELRADATSFFQVNPAVAEELVRVVQRCLGEERALLLDLYAGVGLFAVCLGRDFAKVVAVEADGRAARHLKRNLKRMGVRGEARAERAEEALRSVPRGPGETVLLDPPRVGLSAEARAALLRRGPGRIVSVSCDPATAARDVGALTAAGWRLERLVVLDAFPVTAHVETVALLVRDGPESEPGPPSDDSVSS